MPGRGRERFGRLVRIHTYFTPISPARPIGSEGLQRCATSIALVGVTDPFDLSASNFLLVKAKHGLEVLRR